MSKIYIVINESHEQDGSLDYSIERVYESKVEAKNYLQELFEMYRNMNSPTIGNFKLTEDYLMFNIIDIGYEKYYILETELFKNN